MLRTLPPVPLMLALTLSLLANPAWASGDKPIKGLVIFGDSLSDPGNAFVLTGKVSVRPFELIPDAPYLIGGLHFSNGKTWVEQLAAELDLRRDARPAFLAPGFFSNYAVGGARARGDGPTDFTSQVSVFLSIPRHKRLDDRLYVIWVGGNDVLDAFAALASPAEDPTMTTEAIISAAVTAITDNIAALVEAGARRFLVPNAPDIGLVPAVTPFGPEAAAAATTLSGAFNAALDLALDGLEEALPIQIVRVDIFQIVNDVVEDPQAVGLSNAEDACITPGVIRGAICGRPNEYLFWDGIHPTRTGHAIVAARAEAALAEALPVGHESGHGSTAGIHGLANTSIR
jgi:phospholipase/lecithinase/hemolysin